MPDFPSAEQLYAQTSHDVKSMLRSHPIPIIVSSLLYLLFPLLTFWVPVKTLPISVSVGIIVVRSLVGSALIYSLLTFFKHVLNEIHPAQVSLRSKEYWVLFGGFACTRVAAELLVNLGLGFMVLPGIVFWLWTLVLLPVVVFERKWLFSAYERSRWLIGGYRLRVIRSALPYYMAFFVSSLLIPLLPRLSRFSPSLDILLTSPSIVVNELSQLVTFLYIVWNTFFIGNVYLALTSVRSESTLDTDGPRKRGMSPVLFLVLIVLIVIAFWYGSILEKQKLSSLRLQTVPTPSGFKILIHPTQGK